VTYIVLVFVLSAVTYRVGRFIVLDTMIDTPREKLMVWLEEHPRWLWAKLYELIGCPWCVTIWVAAGAVGLQTWVVGGVPVPVWTWLAVASGSLVWWTIIDNDD
jgi:hypothetical protein